MKNLKDHVAGSIIGIDMGGTSIKAGLVRNGKVGEVLSRPVQRENTVIECIDKMKDLIAALQAEDTFGIGIGVPSVVDTKEGVVYDVQNIPAWKEVPLKKILEQEVKLPVYINNDANCFALGEHHFGKGKGIENLVGLTLGTGMGAGLILNGKLYEGVNCGAGELGMLPYKEGCLENYSSGQFFTRQYDIRGEEVFEQAKAGDKKAVCLFNEFGFYMAQAISAAVYAYDPEMIILGGSVSLGFPYFEKSMREELKDFPFQNSIKNLKIVQSDIKHIAILGGAALVLHLK